MNNAIIFLFDFLLLIANEVVLSFGDVFKAPIVVESPNVWLGVRTWFWWRPAEATQNRCANPCHAADLQRIAGIAS